MKQYTGMRKGISIVEMMIAIVLFAALSVISLKYAKNYFDTDMAAKKARVAALTDQAAQLLAAYQIYKTETGTEPTSINDMNGSSSILTNIPTNIIEMSTAGWQFAADYNGTGNPAFYFTIDLNGSTNTAAQQKAGKEYCAAFNREFNATDGNSSLLVADTTTFYTEGDAATSKTQANRNQFCYSVDANKTAIAIFVP